MTYIDDNPKVLREITPIRHGDCLYISNRHNKVEWTYPIHIHSEYELNLVKGVAGMKRIVGSSTQTIGEYDLVLIASEFMPHGYLNTHPVSKPGHEILVQFSPNLFSSNFLHNNQSDSIREMLERAKRGLAFPEKTIKKVEPIFIQLTQEPQSFHTMMKFMRLLYELSLCGDSQQLSKALSGDKEKHIPTQRETRIINYIEENYRKKISARELAKIEGISESELTEAFKLQTSTTLSRYINNLRITDSLEKLVGSTMSISEICYYEGFSTLASFDRIFHQIIGCSPKEYRLKQKKNSK